MLHILWTTSFTSTSNRWLCQWTPPEVDFLKQTRTDPSPNLCCICLERCWRITSCRKTRAQCFYVIVLAKPVGIYVISFAIKFLKFKIGSTNIDGHSTKAVFFAFPGTLRKKSEDPCLETCHSLLVGKHWLMGQSLEIHWFQHISTVWIWFGFIHHHFMSCTALGENYANLILVS